MSSIRSQTSKPAIGMDFGTTNSSIACADRSGEVQLAKFPYLKSLTDSYRSLLYLQQTKVGGANTLKSWTGPEGIEQYLSADAKGRLIQSLKSFLCSRNLHSTEVFGRRHTIEDLIARILRDLREKAEHQFGVSIRSAVIGRPVHFVGAENQEDDDYAEGRLRLAFESAGYESVEFEMEPVADVVDALWVMLRFGAHETPVGTEPLLGLPDRRTVRLRTVGETDADVYGDFLYLLL
jgi:hypothetical chaperone protein